MSRRPNLTEAQLKKLMQQAPTNPQAAKKAERGAYEAEIETAIVEAMEKDGWRAWKMEYNFDRIKKLTLGEPGMADHLFIRPDMPDDRPLLSVDPEIFAPTCQVLWWEFKAGKKRRKRAEYLSSDQVQWQQLARALGFLVWSAGVDHEADVASAAQHYLDSGLARRREIFVALIPPEARARQDRDRRLGDGE